MKIYLLPIDERFRPKSQPFKYPRHNNDFGVEQDFLDYLLKNKENILVDDPIIADWHYLPVFWTRWHLNHDYAKTGLDELQEEVSNVVFDWSKTFTVCQYDDGPVIDLKNTLQFLASRKSDKGIDIPLLCQNHKMPLWPPKKKYLASFIGLNTHPIRQQMLELLNKDKDIYLLLKSKRINFFIRKALSSYVALAPRGYGGSSFRLFEAMQLGIAPFLIGDLDTRPFKKFIDWDKISFYTDNVLNIKNIIKLKSKDELILIGAEAKRIYESELKYGKWCKYVLFELENINK